jgi:glutamine amidotransferase
VRPAWNDPNLRDIAAQVNTRLCLAHVRATSHATIQESNCHPFRHGSMLFVHNGHIAQIEKLHRDLLFAVDPELFPFVQGSTDSEVMFFLALTFGLREDPMRGLARMAGYVEETARRRGVEQPLLMTIGLTDGRDVWAVRYASEGKPPSLFHSRGVSDIVRLNPEIAGRLDSTTRIVVSEPIGSLVDAWEVVPRGSILRFSGGRADAYPFVPEPPDSWPLVSTA